MANLLCSECIEDSFLQEILRAEGTEGRCDVCGENRLHAITIHRLGELIEPLIRKYYRPGSFVHQFFEDEKDDIWEQKGDDLSSIVQRALGNL